MTPEQTEALRNIKERQAISIERIAQIIELF